MTVVEIKSNLHQLIDKEEDVSVLSSVLHFLKKENNDIWDSLSEEERNAVEEGLKDVETGNVISLEAFMVKHKKKVNYAS